MPRSIGILCLLAIVAVGTGCLGGGRGGPIMMSTWDLHMGGYGGRTPHKASAIGIGADGRVYFGMASGHESQEAAVARALAECNDGPAQLARLGTEPAAVACRPYAIGDELVWQFSEATPRVGCFNVPVVDAYIRGLYRRIGWTFRPFETRENDAYLLSLVLERTGEIHSLEVETTTTNRAVEEAIEAVEDAAPFFPLFGALGCLEGLPIPLQFGEPATGA